MVYYLSYMYMYFITGGVKSSLSLVFIRGFLRGSWDLQNKCKVYISELLNKTELVRK